MSYNYIPLIIMGSDSVQSSGILNPNAFPKELRTDVYACGDKLSLIYHSVKIIQDEIKRDVNQFINELHHNNIFKGFVPDHAKPVLAIYHNMSFQGVFQSFFIAIKSMLDMYAKIISKSILPESELFGFNKANVRGEKRVGGKLLNWIEHNAPDSYNNRDKLIKILNGNIDEWIKDVVAYRDDIVHKGELKGSIEMCVPLTKTPNNIQIGEIILPTLPNMKNVLEYCKEIQKKINIMLKDTLILLPNVNTELINL